VRSLLAFLTDACRALLLVAADHVGRAQDVDEPVPVDPHEAVLLALHGPLLHAWAEHVQESADDELEALVEGWGPQ